MKWKLDDSRPIWPQLKEQLIAAIVTGKYPMGGPFPTVRELAESAGVNRNTMQRALSELEHDGFVITNRTAGRVVTTDERLVMGMKEMIARETIDRFIKEMESIGYTADDVLKMLKEREGENK